MGGSFSFVNSPKGATFKVVLLAFVLVAIFASCCASKHGKLLISVRDHGAKGNGKTDDTKAIRSAFSEAKQRQTDTNEIVTVHFPVCNQALYLLVVIFFFF